MCFNHHLHEGYCQFVKCCRVVVEVDTYECERLRPDDVRMLMQDAPLERISF